jgi:hypothetical protein
LAGAALIASAVAVVTASGTASAMFHRGLDFTSGDPRATAHQTRDFTLNCQQAGLAGSRVDVTAFTDNAHQRLTVTAVPAGVRLTGLVVQGALAYNRYPQAGLGSLPYQDLHSPVYRGDRPVLVLRWFACGTQAVSAAVNPTPTGTSGPSADPADPTASGSDPTDQSAATAGPGANDDPRTGPGHPTDPDAPVGPAAPPASAPAPDSAADGGTGASSGPAGQPESSAAPSVLGANPPRATAVRLRGASRMDFGASLYLALAMLLLVTGGLLVVAPRQLTLGVTRLRHRS